MRQLGHDLRQAARLLVRRPGVSALVVITLATGIAATTIAFSLADAILWHPLPFPDADRLVRVRASLPAGMIAAPLEAWPPGKQAFDGLYPFGLDSGILNVGGEPQAVTIGVLSPGLLGALGVSPLWGRDFNVADSQPGSDAIIVSAELSRRLELNAATSGTVLLEGVRRTVIGAMPDGFDFPVSRVAVWRPGVRSSAATRMTALGRLKSNVTLATAQALALPTMDRDVPQQFVRNVQVTPFVMVNVTTSTALRVVLGAAALLLLIAVANTANVLLADAVRRDAELAIRAAIGASWPQLARQLLTETLVVTAVAVGAATIASAWVLAALVKAVPYVMSFQTLRAIGLDWRALIFAAVIATVAGAAASWLSLMRAARVDAQSALRGRASGNSRQARTRNALTIAQIAVTVALLASAGLLMKVVVGLGRVDPGFDPDHVVDVVVQMPSWRFAEDTQAQAALDAVRAEAARLPDVLGATISHAMPPSLGSRPLQELSFGDGAAPAGDGLVSVGLVDDAFFSTMRIPLRSGRTFDSRDRRGSEPVAIVSQALADAIAPNGDVLGRRMRESKDAPWLTVVGVAGNIAGSAVDQAETRMAYYTARAQAATWWFEGLIVRTRPEPGQVVPALRAIFGRVMPDAPVIEVITAHEATNNSNARVHFAAVLMTAVSAVALSLALIGVYGAFWCAVRQRTREIGVRLALGATPGDALRLVLGLSARLTLAGLAAGLPLAFIATRTLGSLLLGVSPNDPATFAAAAAFLAVAAMAAAYLPARYASRIDPSTVLRQ